jgi:RNA polymerase sigma-70 factor, ECF subfamily
LRDAMLAAVPQLRAFAMSLSGNIDRADDLVQETLSRALAGINSFEPGTNLPAWLFTILRNLFFTEYRKRRREVEDIEGKYAQGLSTHPEQMGRIDFKEFQHALGKIPADQREALILVSASGFSYEEASEICGCAVKIGESVVYRILRVNQGRFLVMAVTTQPARDKIRYLIRSQDDGNIERVVNESELSTT